MKAIAVEAGRGGLLLMSRGSVEWAWASSSPTVSGLLEAEVGFRGGSAWQGMLRQEEADPLCGVVGS